MQCKLYVFLIIPILFISGCSNKSNSSTNTTQPVNLFPNLDRTRLMIPDEWKSLESKSLEMATRDTKPSVEEYVALLDSKIKIFSSPNRPHPQELGFIPMNVVHVSRSLYEMGNQEIACGYLSKLKDLGLLCKSFLKEGKGIDVDERTLKLTADCPENLTENELGKYIVRQPAYFNLVDFESIEMNPPFPKIAPDNQKVYVVFTGPAMSDSDIADLEQAVEAGAEAHAIVTQKGQAAKGVTIHLAMVEPRDLIASNTGLVWFANKKGDVCAFLRPYSGDYSKPIVNYLSNAKE